MSLKAMVYAIHDSRARGMAKFVQILIADYVDKDTGQAGPPGPSLDTLAKDGGIGKATVWRQIEKLTTLGELAIDRGARGAGNTNVYIFPRYADQLGQRSAPEQGDGPDGKGPERNKVGGGKGPQKVRKRSAESGRSMDDPYPDPSSGTGSSFPHPESKRGSQGRHQPRRKQPRTPRPPDDPQVLATAAAIRSDGGRGAQRRAASYLRVVAEEWGRHQAGVALTQHLAGEIGTMPDA